MLANIGFLDYMIDQIYLKVHELVSSVYTYTDSEGVYQTERVFCMLTVSVRGNG